MRCITPSATARRCDAHSAGVCYMGLGLCIIGGVLHPFAHAHLRPSSLHVHSSALLRHRFTRTGRHPTHPGRTRNSICMWNYPWSMVSLGLYSYMEPHPGLKGPGLGRDAPTVGIVFQESRRAHLINVCVLSERFKSERFRRCSRNNLTRCCVLWRTRARSVLWRTPDVLWRGPALTGQPKNAAAAASSIGP